MASDLKTLRESGHMLCEFALEDGSTFALRPAYPSAPKVRQKDAEVFSALRKQSTVFFFDDATPKPDAVLNWVESRYDQDETQINFFIISPFSSYCESKKNPKPANIYS